MNINIDNKLRFEENKEKIYENLTKPDPSKFYSDMKIERVRDIIKENKNGSYSIDILNLMVLGFDNITSAKLFSKNKTSLESNNIKAKLLTSHWSDNKWWSKNKTEYLKYLD